MSKKNKQSKNSKSPGDNNLVKDVQMTSTIVNHMHIDSPKQRKRPANLNSPEIKLKNTAIPSTVVPRIKNIDQIADSVGSPGVKLSKHESVTTQ